MKRPWRKTPPMPPSAPDFCRAMKSTPSLLAVCALDQGHPLGHYDPDTGIAWHERTAVLT